MCLTYVCFSVYMLSTLTNYFPTHSQYTAIRFNACIQSNVLLQKTVLEAVVLYCNQTSLVYFFLVFFKCTVNKPILLIYFKLLLLIIIINLIPNLSVKADSF